MNFLNNLIKLLAQPPGDLVYFLVVLFALQQAMAALYNIPPTIRSYNHRRWQWAIGAMLGGRLLLLLLGLLSNVDLLAPNAVIPPAEHFVETVSAALFFWAVVGEVRQRPLQTGLMGIVIALALALYLYDAVNWPSMAAQRPYNGTLTELLWEGSTAVILGLALLWALIARPRNWEWYLAILAFWLGGHIAQIGWVVHDLDFAPWERAAALVWAPLLALTLQRHTIETALHEAALSTYPLRPRKKRPNSLLAQLNVGALQSLLRGISEARELEPALILASSRLATLLRADLCAIALSDETHDGIPALQLTAIHPPTGQLDLPQLTAAHYPDLFALLEAGATHLFTDRQAAHWLPLFYEALGIEGSGPLLAVPMRVEGHTIGMLFFGTPTSQQIWDKESILLFRLVAALLAAVIHRSQQRGSSILTLEEDDAEIARLKEEAHILQKRIAELEREARTRERELDRLRKELNQRPRIHETELAFWKNEMKELVQDRDMLIRERTRLMKEITDLKSRYDSLREERDRLQGQLQKAARQIEQLRAHLQQLDQPQKTIAGLIVTDAQGRIVMADSIARQMLGLADNVIGMPLDGLYADRKWVEAINNLLAANSTLRRAHITLEVKDNIIEAEMMTLLDASGMPDALAVTLNSHESMAEEREALLGMVSELRTPMTSIIGYTDLLLTEQVGILNAMQTQFLERVKANIERMGQMLDDLVKIVSPEQTRDITEPEPVDLLHVLEEAIVGMAARFRERRVGVRMDMPDELSPVRANRDALYQIILRLLSNAVLCSREGSEIVIRARDQKVEQGTAFVHISITDTCGGIAPEDMPRVFRRFYRAQQPLIQGMGESGIGMAMVKTLVEANGGRIWVESEPGIGSTFTFILPAYQDVRTTV